MSASRNSEFKVWYIVPFLLQQVLPVVGTCPSPMDYRWTQKYQVHTVQRREAIFRLKSRQLQDQMKLQEIFTLHKRWYLFSHSLTPSISSAWPLIKSGSHRDTSCCNSLPVVDQWLPHAWPGGNILVVTVIFWRLICCSNRKSKQENQCLHNRTLWGNWYIL